MFNVRLEVFHYRSCGLLRVYHFIYLLETFAFLRIIQREYVRGGYITSGWNEFGSLTLTFN